MQSVAKKAAAAFKAARDAKAIAESARGYAATAQSIASHNRADIRLLERRVGSCEDRLNTDDRMRGYESPND
jgi:hypothetical protein